MSQSERLARNVLLGAAAFRITRLLQADTILKDWREDKLYPRYPYKGAYYGATSDKFPTNPPSAGWKQAGSLPNGKPLWLHENGTFLGNGFHCPWCLSVWVSVALSVQKNPFKWFIDSVAIAGFCMIARKAAGDL